MDVSSDAQRSRLTVNLANAGAFTTRVEGNTFILKLILLLQSLLLSLYNNRSLRGLPILVSSGVQGEGLVVIDLAGQNTPVDVQQQGTKVIVRTLGSKIPHI